MHRKTWVLALFVLSLVLLNAPVAAAAPTADADASTLTFGTQAQTTLSPSQTVTITNNGDEPLVVNGETFAADGTNDGADDFLVSSSTCGGSIAPAGTCEVRVRFVPSGLDARSAKLQILSNAGTTEVVLSGTGGDLPKGDKGDQGDKGDKGDKGDTGDACLPTNPACVGPKGDQGLQGVKGDACLSSDAACRGPKGDTGDPCLPTNSACVGPKGDQGLQGVKGDACLSSDAACRGPKGDKGDKGDACLPTDSACRGPKGDPGLQGVKGDACLSSDAACRGPKGDQGDDGAKGDKGDRGDPCPATNPACRGPRGAVGPRGLQGPAGRDATIACKVAKPKNKKSKPKVTCTVRFENAKSAARVRMRLTSGAYLVGAGGAKVRDGRATVRFAGVGRARYTLRLTTIDANGRRTDGRAAVRIP